VAERARAEGLPGPRFKLTLHHDRLNWPLENLPKKPKRPVRSFVTDMGDLFHANVSDEFIYKVFETMLKCHSIGFTSLQKELSG